MPYAAIYEKSNCHFRDNSERMRRAFGCKMFVLLYVVGNFMDLTLYFSLLFQFLCECVVCQY